MEIATAVHMKIQKNKEGKLYYCIMYHTHSLSEEVTLLLKVTGSFCSLDHNRIKFYFQYRWSTHIHPLH